MNPTRTHSKHMLVIAAVAMSALLLGYGAGWAVAIALLGCGAMIIAVVLLLRENRSAPGAGVVDNTTTPSPRRDRHIR